MEKPNPTTTKGVPWGDHNPTETTPPDRRREEYEADEAERMNEEAVRHDRDLVESEQAEDN